MSTEDDSDLDALLARSAPAVSTAAPQVQREVGALVRAVTAVSAPSRTSRRRSARRLAVGAGAVAVALAGVSTAAASPSAPTWLAWADWGPERMVAEPPGSCALWGLKVVPYGAPEDDPAVVAAREYLADLDLIDVDIADELVEHRSSLVSHVDGVPTRTTAGDLFTDAQLEYTAYNAVITKMIFREVERQGLDPGRMSIESRADGCDLEVYR
jgi:hypothetical protein